MAAYPIPRCDHCEVIAQQLVCEFESLFCLQPCVDHEEVAVTGNCPDGLQ